MEAGRRQVLQVLWLDKAEGFGFSVSVWGYFRGGVGIRKRLMFRCWWGSLRLLGSVHCEGCCGYGLLPTSAVLLVWRWFGGSVGGSVFGLSGSFAFSCCILFLSLLQV